MNNYDILILDTETGGLDAHKNGLCSVTFKVKGENNKCETFFIAPENGMEYTPKALEVNGLTLEKMREVGIEPKEAVENMKKFIRDNFGYSRPFALGHNINFDMNFLNAFFKRHDDNDFSQYVDYHLLDTMMFAQLLHHGEILRHTRFRLATVYRELFGSDFPNAHTSEGDVLATEAVFEKQVKILKDMRKLALQKLKDGRKDEGEFDD